MKQNPLLATVYVKLEQKVRKILRPLEDIALVMQKDIIHICK